MRAFWYDNQPVSPPSSPTTPPNHTPPPSAASTSNTHFPQGDQRLLHDSGRAVSPEYLASLGVLYYNFPNTSETTDIDTLASERSYKNRDVITVSPEKMGDVYEEKVKSFFNEHLHEDEEIRYIRDGAGYFDVRSEGDEWVRIRLEKGDLIVSSPFFVGSGV